MDLIKNFKQISKKDVSIAGGKGASLGEMTQAKIPVPEGFVILSNTFDRFIEETDLNVEIDAVLDSVDIKEIHTIENASEKIKAIILSKEIPEDIKAEILKYYKKLNSKFVAVRSSATSEDSASAAWAGQLDSFLNTTNETLLENVKKCWASLFTPRAIFYRFEKKLNKEKISVAVVVQKMVDSEESGIAFSVHPVTQDKNQIIIEAGLGLGEAIVSGTITPDNYVIDKQGFNILDININKQTKALHKKTKGGSEWRELGEKGKKQVLNEKEIVELSKLIVKIENHYSFPCDIEWAKEKGKFYIVQSRPITTLVTEKKKIEKEKWEELIRSELCLYNTCIPFHSIQYSNTFLGGPKYRKLGLYIKENMGYYYENFNDHYTVGNYCLKKFIEDKKEFQKYTKLWNAEFLKLIKFLRSLRKTELTSKSNKDLVAYLEKVYNMGIYWHGIAYNVDAIDATLNPLLEKLIEKVYMDEKKSKQSEIYNRLTFPNTLSYINRMNLEKLNLFKKLNHGKIKESGKEITNFIDKYFWINFSWGESVEYSKEDLLKEYKSTNLKKINKELEKINGNIENSLRDKKRYINEIKIKEPIIINYIDIFEEYAVFHDLRKEGQVTTISQIRRIYEELAKRLKININLLNYLWPLELAKSIKNEEKPDINLMKKRSNEWFCEYKSNGLSMEYFGQEADKKRNMLICLEGEQSKELSGTGASQGRVIGTAKVCLSAKIATKKITEGDILVTGMTMPEFIDSMKKSAAVVTDEGGLTCHAAIIARELGKPCVVGTKMATRIIKDGDKIEVNANHGVVKILTD